LNDFIVKRKTCRLKDLPLSTRLEIAHSVIIGLRCQREVAVDHNVKPALVNNIVRVFKKFPWKWEELKRRELFIAQKEDFIVETVENL
jgi:hypothetical protein